MTANVLSLLAHGYVGLAAAMLILKGAAQQIGVPLTVVAGIGVSALVVLSAGALVGNLRGSVASALGWVGLAVCAERLTSWLSRAFATSSWILVAALIAAIVALTLLGDVKLIVDGVKKGKVVPSV